MAPVPVWRTVFLHAGTTAWVTPQDWNNSQNTIEAIGSGAGGMKGGGYLLGSGGGGGGAYTFQTNVSLTPGAVVGVQVGTGGPGGPVSGPTPSLFGQDSIFDTTNRTVVAKGGGVSFVWEGGLATHCIPAANAHNGGQGNTYCANWTGAGGGGAGGPHGPGGAATPGNSPTNVSGGGNGGGAADGGGNGGVGNATNGGAGGVSTGLGGGAGGAGGNPDTPGQPGGSGGSGSWAGGGGGGGGGTYAAAAAGKPSGGNGAAGGLYGGGGGGGSNGLDPGGKGGDGVIIITYLGWEQPAPPPPAPGQPPYLREMTYRRRFLGKSFDPSLVITKDRPGPLRIVELDLWMN